MARRMKKGIDYFSHDVDVMQDKKMRLIKAKHKLTGYAVFFRLLEEIYRGEGYFVKADEDFKILFSDDCSIELSELNTILDDLIEYGLFSRVHAEKHSILTSFRIQVNYFEATKRYKEVFVLKEYLCEIEKLTNYINRDNVNINCESVDINPTKEKKGKEKKLTDDAINIATILSEYILKEDPGNFNLSDSKKEKTIERWAEDIDKLNRINKRSFPLIEKVLRWAKEDDFWNKNIMSGKKFRDQFDNLFIKSGSEVKEKDCNFCYYKVNRKNECWREGKKDCGSWIKAD